jgi:hypothetical protein
VVVTNIKPAQPMRWVGRVKGQAGEGAFPLTHVAAADVQRVKAIFAGEPVPPQQPSQQVSRAPAPASAPAPVAAPGSVPAPPPIPPRRAQSQIVREERTPAVPPRRPAATPPATATTAATPAAARTQPAAAAAPPAAGSARPGSAAVASTASAPVRSASEYVGGAKPGGLALPVIATHNYAGTEPGDLALAAGDVIEVLSKDGPDWWTGRNQAGKTGRFPVNHVRRCRTLAEARGLAAAEVSLKTTEAVQSMVDEKAAKEAERAAKEAKEAEEAAKRAKQGRKKPIEAPDSGVNLLAAGAGGSGGGGGGGALAHSASAPASAPQQPAEDPAARAARRAEQRRRIVAEITSSEESYVTQLQLVHTEYKELLETLALRQSMKILEKEDIDAIFCNLTELLSLGQRFLERLKARPEAGSLGAIFAEFAPAFEVYSAYVNNYDHSMAVLARVKQQDKFRAFCDENQATAKGLDLSSFLIMPVQRIPRYELLLREVIKQSEPDHPDLPRLEAAAEAVKQVANRVNNAKAEAENAKAVAELATKFGTTLSFPLAVPGRMLIRQGKLNKNPSTGSGLAHRRHFFLFTDVLIYAARNKEQFEHKGTIELVASTIERTKDGFEINSPRGKFVISAEDDQEASSWYADIASTMKRAQEKATKS